MNSINLYYDMIFKRKSFHLFRSVGDEKIEPEEIEEIIRAYSEFDCLIPNIKTAIRIVKADEINFKRDAEYCILIYSEKKDNYLTNVGYIGEQLDLYLVSRNIGTLWYGIGKPDEKTYNGLDFVIMIAVRKVTDQSKYRKDMFKAKRKPTEQIWAGNDYGIADIARFAPSACNSQPWFCESKDGEITVFRYRKKGKIGIMPNAAVPFYNRIDMGIYLCFIEICMARNNISFERETYVDSGGDDEYTKIAKYTLC